MSVTQVFRCDKILYIKESAKYQPKALADFIKSTDTLYKKINTTDFKIVISKAGIDLYYKENYPLMELFFFKEQYFIRGFYNKG